MVIIYHIMLYIMFRSIMTKHLVLNTHPGFYSLSICFLLLCSSPSSLLHSSGSPCHHFIFVGLCLSMFLLCLFCVEMNNKPDNFWCRHNYFIILWLNGVSVKLVNQFTYLGSYISSTETMSTDIYKRRRLLLTSCRPYVNIVSLIK